MVLYVILFFIAICVGMAVSVYAFGTGGKRKRIFQDIYFSVEDTDGHRCACTKTGEYSAVLKSRTRYRNILPISTASMSSSNLFFAIAQTLGEGYAIHKQDIFTRGNASG